MTRNRRVMINLTKKEYDDIEKISKNFGLSVSQFIRALSVGGTRQAEELNKSLIQATRKQMGVK